jgi:threonyl-tRNA synthetase
MRMSEQIFPLSTKRHSLAHLLAQACQRYIDPTVQLGTWPSLDTGFYYDVLFAEGISFSGEQLKDLTKKIQLIAKEPQSYVVYECPVSHGYEINALTGQTLKNELLDKFTAQWEQFITYYLNVTPSKTLEFVRETLPGYQEMYVKTSAYFIDKGVINPDQAVVYIDLCAGPHVETSKDLDASAMVLEKVAGAYWQADEKNAQMTRIYGLAFETKEDLQAYQNMMEEAKKRDHRILGQKLKLFTLSDLVWSGLPLFQPNGMILRKELTDYLRELHKNHGYQWVRTPHLAKEALYECSGHAGHYLDDMFHVHGGTSKEDYFLKPMNCPHHMQLFADNQFSYRDMPIRYFEPATVYRDEKTGQLSWLTRVRSITQDDGHLFCRIWQLKEEITTIVDIVKQFYTTVGMIDKYRVSLSVRGEDKSKYLGSDDKWEIAEQALKEICDDLKLNYKEMPGEAAFYGPKLDFQFNDAIGRERQLATIQIDFNQPERFDLSFVNEEWEKERPVVIHRAISWSLERFIGVMIEHFAGAFPVWLAPTQVAILPVSDTFNDYATEIKQLLAKQNIRVQLDDAPESLNKKIRNAEVLKIPYMLIIGEKEQTDRSVSVRVYKTKEQYEISLEQFSEQIVKEYKERTL